MLSDDDSVDSWDVLPGPPTSSAQSQASAVLVPFARGPTPHDGALVPLIAKKSRPSRALLKHRRVSVAQKCLAASKMREASGQYTYDQDSREV